MTIVVSYDGIVFLTKSKIRVFYSILKMPFAKYGKIRYRVISFSIKFGQCIRMFSHDKHADQVA
jgi:hypothetical protein